MWSRSENGEVVKPSEIEYSGNNVILRKNFTLIPDTDEMPMHWEYDEWQMTAGEYEVYLALAPKATGPVTPMESEYRATRNYDVNDLLTVDGTFYKALRNIGAGQKIVPYLNVIKTDLTEVKKEA